MAFKVASHSVIDLDTGGDTKITSAEGQDIVFYPDQHIWIKQGTKLIFEGTVPDDFEAKLQATAVTADRDIILPDESGTLATQAYVTSAVTGGALSNTDALAEGSTNLYFTDARALAATDGEKVLFKNVYSALGDLPSATDYHGMFAHVHAEGKAYFAHGGNWVPLANSADTISDIVNDTTPELGGDLVTAGNRITHAASGTVSFLDFTKTMFSESNHTVLSSVKSIDLFLDSNGGDAGQAFRIYNNQNPDGTVTENTHIFKVAESGDVSVGNDLSVAGDATITGNATITGDLTVSGTTTTINSNELAIGDNIITLNADETGAPTQNAGIQVERGTSANVELRYNESLDQWEFTNDGTNYVAFGTSSTFSGNSDGIAEGTTNLYFTNARADTRATLRITAADIGNLNNVSATAASTGEVLKWSGTEWAPAADTDTVYTTFNTDFDTRLGTKSTTNLSEGTNQYFTNARAISALTSADIQMDSLGVGTAASGTTGEIRATHDVTAYYSSDATLKENVSNLTNALDKVQQIRGVEFDWKQEYIDAKGGEDDYFLRKHDVGVIAQEVEAVLPEVVGTRQDGVKAVKYDRLTALLIEAIKDQQSQIEELRSTIEELKNK